MKHIIQMSLDRFRTNLSSEYKLWRILCLYEDDKDNTHAPGEPLSMCVRLFFTKSRSFGGEHMGVRKLSFFQAAPGLLKHEMTSSDVSRRVRISPKYLSF